MSQGFVSLDRGAQDQAARAAVAVLTRRLERKAGGKLTAVTAWGVGEFAHRVLGGVFAFPASSVNRWARYANAVAQSGEHISNRKWAEYPSNVRAAALEVADRVHFEMTAEDWLD